MKRTNEISIVLEYDDSDIICEGEDCHLDQATINGFGVEAQPEILEIANEDAMFCNQLYWEKKEAERKSAIDAADYRYHSLVDAHFERMVSNGR